MKKPESSDFGLNEELIQLNNKQHNDYEQYLEDYIKKSKLICKTIMIISIVISVIASIMFFVSISLEYENSVVAGLCTFCYFWDFGYGIFYLTFRERTVNDISTYKRNQFRGEIIDTKVDNAVLKYYDAIKEYEESTLSINEYSLVKIEYLLPEYISESPISFGISWICFSNKYLANPRSFPDISGFDENDRDFQTYYYSLVSKQKTIKPKPKKYLNIEEKMEFYYPCSEMFTALKGKREGDIAELPSGYRYNILKVLNEDIKL